MGLIDPASDAATLTQQIVDVPSESGSEAALAEAVEAALRGVAVLRVDRDGDAVVARTNLGRARRVLIAGHLDTVPAAGNLPSARRDGRITGCGSTDMKAALAVMLRLATAPGLVAAESDLTFVFYDNEEVAAARNGLKRLVEQHRDWLAADLAILMEPTSALVEAGCQGTLRMVTTVPGRRAHSARSWLGVNAIHGAAPLLAALGAYQPRSVDIDGCVYREGLSAVRIDGGVAGNVVPDACTVTVNFRFAPDRDEQQAARHAQDALPGYDWEITDSAPGALPGLTAPAAAHFLAAVGTDAVAKYGWTDVARFAALGIPAVNYGPGDPNLAHTADEYVEVALIDRCETVLRKYLGIG